MALSQYDFTIKYLAGKCNGAADSLSRLDNIKADDLTLYQQQRFDDSSDDFVCVVNGKATTKPNNSGTDGQNVRDDNAGLNETSQLYEPVACAVNNALLYRPSCSFDFTSNDVCLTNVDVRMTKDACCGTSDDDDNGAAKPATSTKDDDVVVRLEPRLVNSDAVTIDQSPRVQADKAQNYTRTIDAIESQKDLIHENANLLKAIDRMPDSDFGRPAVSKTAENCVDENEQSQTRQQPNLIAGVHKRTKGSARKRSQNLGNNVTKTQTDAQTNMLPQADNSDDMTLTARSADCPGGAACGANSGSAAGISRESNADIDNAGDTADLEITLAMQAQDSDFEHIINYLLCGSLPPDDKIAKRTAILADYYTILDEKLFHLTVPRRKNNTSQQSLMRQLCIPSKMQNEVMRKYHCQLMHVGSEKMYLSLRCKLYWLGMYGDVTTFRGLM